VSKAWDDWSRTEGGTTANYFYFKKLIATWVSEAENVLELGCSAGPNVEFLSTFGTYHGIDVSEDAVRAARQRHPKCADKIVQGDFSDEIPFDVKFDLVVDRASLAHNDKLAIQLAVENVRNVMSPGAIFVCSDWFSVSHSEALRGALVELGLWGRTVTNYPDGQFKNIGKVHFSSWQELTEIFAGFERLFLQERITRRKGPGFAGRSPGWPWEGADYQFSDYDSAVWDLVVRKPK